MRYLITILLFVAMQAQSQNLSDSTNYATFNQLFWNSIGDDIRNDRIDSAYIKITQNQKLIKTYASEYQLNNLDVIKVFYFEFVAKENKIKTNELFDYKKTCHYYHICNTTWLESELRPNYNLYESKLIKFKNEYPSSEYLDDVEWRLTELSILDWAEGGIESFRNAYEKVETYLSNYPESRSVCIATKELIKLMMYTNEHSRTDLITKYNQYKVKCLGNIIEDDQDLAFEHQVYNYKP